MNNIIRVILIVLLVSYLIPLQITRRNAETVTVVGQAQSREKNQMAVFTAGVESVNDKREEAVKEVSTKVEALIGLVKNFGIGAEDIKTQNINMYQSEENYWEGGVQKSRKGQWRVSNSVEITLRETDRVAGLTDLLASSGANNVWGPNWQFADTSKVEKELSDAVLRDAREKAEALAKAAGRKVGRVVSMADGATGTDVYSYKTMAEGGGGGAPIEPGMGTVQKTVTVVFELK